MRSLVGYRQERFLVKNPAFAKALGLQAPGRVPSEEYDILLEKESKTPDDLARMQAYKIYVPAELVEDYVDYKAAQGEGYEDDWWMMEHPDFYKEIYLGILGNERKDYRKVPTREVFTKYQEFLGLIEGKPRDDFRWDNRDLDDWLVLKFGYTPIMEKRRRAALTPAERLAEEVAARIRSVKELAVNR